MDFNSTPVTAMGNLGPSLTDLLERKSRDDGENCRGSGMRFLSYVLTGTAYDRGTLPQQSLKHRRAAVRISVIWRLPTKLKVTCNIGLGTL